MLACAHEFFTCVHLCVIRVDSSAFVMCQHSQGARVHTPTKLCTTRVYGNARVCSERFLRSQDIYNLYGVCVCVHVCLCLCSRHKRCCSRHKRTCAHATCLCVVVFMSVLTCAWFARSQALRALVLVCAARKMSNLRSICMRLSVELLPEASCTYFPPCRVS